MWVSEGRVILFNIMHKHAATLNHYLLVQIQTMTHKCVSAIAYDFLYITRVLNFVQLDNFLFPLSISKYSACMHARIYTIFDTLYIYDRMQTKNTKNTLRHDLL